MGSLPVDLLVNILIKSCTGGVPRSATGHRKLTFWNIFLKILLMLKTNTFNDSRKKKRSLCGVKYLVSGVSGYEVDRGTPPVLQYSISCDNKINKAYIYLKAVDLYLVLCC